MAWQVVQAVLRARITPAGRKLVALGLAEHARKDGTGSFPGMDRLKVYSGITEGRVLEHIRNLMNDGIVERARRGHEGQRAEYRLNLPRLAELEDPRLPPPEDAGDSTLSDKRMPETAPSPSKRVPLAAAEGATGGTPSIINRQEQTLAAKRKALFAALVEVERLNPQEITAGKRGALNRAVKDLLAVDADPGGVPARAERYRREHPDWTLTANALAKHWPELGSEKEIPAPWTPCQGMDCDQRATEGLYCADCDARRPKRRAAGGEP
jgi:hypothetical protein